MSHSPRIIAIIPARYGSTRFPGKPLVMIQGKTLLQRTYENAQLCPLIDKFIVATDDQRIYDHVRSFGGNVVMTPENCPTGSDRIAYVLENDPTLQQAEIVINIQGDEPFLSPEATKRIIEALRNAPSAVMGTGIYPLEPEEAENPNTVKCVTDLHGYALYFSRALLPAGRTLKLVDGISYYKHLGIYAFRPEFLMEYVKLPMTPLQQAEDLEQLKILENGYKIITAVVPRAGAEVNTPEDLKQVERELCKQNSSSSQAESVHL